MCEELQDALLSANNNLDAIANQINTLKISCEYKTSFMRMADIRGFRFTVDTLNEMETIGKTKSKVCIPLLDGKSS